jgi:threonine synthase
LPFAFFCIIIANVDFVRIFTMASNGAAETNGSADTHTPSQRYLSTRGEDKGFSFEDVVLKGLASDGGLYIPEEIPKASDWQAWKDFSFQDLAFAIVSLYVSPSEIPPQDLKGIIERSYATFRTPEITPVVKLREGLHLLELFHGPTFAFKDVALQFLGNLFEYFLVRRNQGKVGRERHHLTVVGATSGDTGSAAIYGLRGKKDVSVFILHPEGRVSPIQEAQMTTVLDKNVHNIALKGTFDDCQDIVKALFADPETNQVLKLGAINSINWARILAQIVYYFHSYFTLVGQSTIQLGDKIRFAVPTGNFGDVLAGYFALRMGLPIEKLVIGTNENDILDRFWKTGKYEKSDGPDGGVKATLSPAMDILVSSNFERLLWFLAYEFAETVGMDDEWNKKQAGQEVCSWLGDLKKKGAFGPVDKEVLANARRDFESERVSDPQTIDTIKDFYGAGDGYILDPHTAVGVATALRSLEKASDVKHISLSTAHPAKFSEAVEKALSGVDGFSFEAKVLPKELEGLDKLEKRVTKVDGDWKKVGEIVRSQVEEELRAAYA